MLLQNSPYIVCGVSRGGTSMVAGCLQIMGVDFGKNRASMTVEDLDIRGKHGHELDKILQEKSLNSHKWGFKYPHLHDYFQESLETLSQCKFIFIFRDVYSVALSYNKYHDIPVDKGLQMAQSRYDKLISMYQQFKESSCLLSYEKSVMYKEQFIDQLSHFVDLPLSTNTHKKLLDFISPGRYKRV